MKITNNLLLLLIFLSTFSLVGQRKNIKKSTKKHQEARIQQENQEKNPQNAEPVKNDSMNEIECRPEAPACPATATDDPKDAIEVNLENTDLKNLLNWISETFEVTFITDDILDPLPQGGKATTGNKITFTTHKPVTKLQVWDLFITFLDLFGFGLVHGGLPDVYKVRQTAPNAPNTINKSPLDAYINVHWRELPDVETRIRYVYFIKNSTLGSLQPIVDSFRSNTALLKPLKELNAFVLTDKASNIRSIMHIIEELDQTTAPEAMSVLKLRNADAQDVVTLYNNLTKAEDPRNLAARILGQKKPPTSFYFPEATRLIAETRTNTLIILGTKEAIEKVEQFIVKHVDVELDTPYSPLYVYDLQYVSAESMASILSEVTKFAPGTQAATSGGVREGDKYLQPMEFKPEQQGNRLLIKAEKEDYLMVRDIIKKLDVKQPQVAIELLIVDVLSTDNRQLGVQIRNNDSSTVSKNLNFQTSGLPLTGGAPSSPVVQSEGNADPGSLVSNLVQLAQNQSPGATLLSIANMTNGVWGIFKILQTYVHTNLISNPFLITANKYQAEVSIGETRRVQTGEVKGTRDTEVYDDVKSNLTVNITPQINSIGIINLNIHIEINTFTDADNPTSANKDTKTVTTNANVGNRQVLALGGLLKTNHDESTRKVPVFGDMPLLGWFFKSKTKIKRKDNLLIFISPRVIEPQLDSKELSPYTQEKAASAQDSFCSAQHPHQQRDPIHRWFFKDKPCENSDYIDNFVQKKNPDFCVDVPESLYCDQSCKPESSPRSFVKNNDEEKHESKTPTVTHNETETNQSASSPPKTRKRASITATLPKNKELTV